MVVELRLAVEKVEQVMVMAMRPVMEQVSLKGMVLEPVLKEMVTLKVTVYRRHVFRSNREDEDIVRFYLGGILTMCR
ncbi:uncharacterized protein A4U43_C07F32010 [Asparagus officinalis]|uniref:Uncharacterized protein n=1 Tax=Asparagus officinalis TaxID=4686 RepID=A0A5P1EGE2_ASPOF|nr:uncharacterized protein A4U43_C07F32010 [Asparagus officinalis]